MSNRALNWAFRLPVTGATKAVLLALADCLNDETGRCDPSRDTLALFAGVDARTVRRACERLRTCGHIAIVERPGRSCQYVLAIGTCGESQGAATPDTVPPHPGHHATPTPDTVTATPDTTPPKPLEPESEPEGEPESVACTHAHAHEAPPPELFSQQPEDEVRSEAATPPPDPSPTPRKRKRLGKNGANIRKRSPIDPTWRPTRDGLDFAVQRGAVDLNHEIEKFVAHHLGIGTEATPWEWSWRWKGWCSRISDFNRVPSRDQQSPFFAAMRDVFADQILDRGVADHG